MRSLAALLLLSFLASGCKSACRTLAEKLCDCALTSVERDGCLRTAQQEDSRVSPSPQDNITCQQLYPGCDCHTINTAAGKVACGLARAPDAGPIPDAGP